MFFAFLIIGVLAVEKSDGGPIKKDLESGLTDLARFFSSRIVGGMEAAEGFAPHMAALVAGEHVTMLTCGGSIVTPILILTAAHCIQVFEELEQLLPSFHAVVGSNTWNRGGEKAEFSGFHIHPQYDHRNIKNDVGFLLMKKILTLNARVATIGMNYDWVGGGEECYVTGWGKIGNSGMTIIPFKLQLLFMKILSPEQCVQGLEAAAVQGGRGPVMDPDLEICTLHSVGHGMCNGDSGSGLLTLGDGKQVGIASWVIGCGVGAPDMFTRISAMREFMQDIILRYS